MNHHLSLLVGLLSLAVAACSSDDTSAEKEACLARMDVEGSHIQAIWLGDACAWGCDFGWVSCGGVCNVWQETECPSARFSSNANCGAPGVVCAPGLTCTLEAFQASPTAPVAARWQCLPPRN